MVECRAVDGWAGQGGLQYNVIFSVSLPPVGYSTYFIVPSTAVAVDPAPLTTTAASRRRLRAGANGPNKGHSSASNGKETPPEAGIVLTNEFLTVTFDPTTNLLSTITNKASRGPCAACFLSIARSKLARRRSVVLPISWLRVCMCMCACACACVQASGISIAATQDWYWYNASVSATSFGHIPDGSPGDNQNSGAYVRARWAGSRLPAFVLLLRPVCRVNCRLVVLRWQIFRPNATSPYRVREGGVPTTVTTGPVVQEVGAVVVAALRRSQRVYLCCSSG